MDKITKRYNSLVEAYKEMEKNINEQSVHDKRVILRRVFPILAAFKIKPSKVKNGNKAFKLYGQLRDIQVQILKLESIPQNADSTKYLSYLREKELKLSKELIRFDKKKQLEFPSIKKKSLVLQYKIFKRANEQFDKLEKKIQARNNDKSSDIHKIRIEFKKFRYLIETYLAIEDAEELKLEKIKMYQDILGEIQDDEILIEGISHFFRKKKKNIQELTSIFEASKKELIDKFDNELETVIQVCRELISLDNDVISIDVTEKITDEKAVSEADQLKVKKTDTGLIDMIDTLKQQPAMILEAVQNAKDAKSKTVLKTNVPVKKPKTPVKKTVKPAVEKIEKPKVSTQKSAVDNKVDVKNDTATSKDKKVTTVRKPGVETDKTGSVKRNNTKIKVAKDKQENDMPTDIK